MSAGERDFGGIGEQEVLPFADILFERVETSPPFMLEQPEHFGDLHLDQLVEPIVTDWREYDLAPHFRTPLRDEDAVRYRQEVFRDLADPAVIGAIQAFTEQMRTMRRRLSVAEKSRFRYERERWFLDAACGYRDAVIALSAELPDHPLASRGLRAFRRYLLAYADDEYFTSFAAETHEVVAGLERIRYIVNIKDTRVTVTTYDGERDFATDVLATFAKFQQGEVKDYRVRVTPGLRMDHVEAQILDIVARSHRAAFGALDRFSAQHSQFRDEVVCRFDQEIHFYLSYLRYIEPLTASGLAVCLPQVSRTSKEIGASGAFDLVLAKKLLAEGRTVVCNDFSLEGSERLLVVTGPNQGGKTTFARMLGQMHQLASIGCPVPGIEAHLYLPDRIFAHFDREEDIRTLRGKLEDELVRIRDIFDEATSDSVVIMNETFTSTTLGDALFLGIEVIQRLTQLDVLGVYVTFVDELASLGPSTVSMVGMVDPADPSVRTFKVLRRAADGLAYAQAIADKHGLSSSALRERLGS
jgi:hypothetical protein